MSGQRESRSLPQSSRRLRVDQTEQKQKASESFKLDFELLQKIHKVLTRPGSVDPDNLHR